MPTEPRKKITCYLCLGTGLDVHTTQPDAKTCPTCRGQGFLLVPQDFLGPTLLDLKRKHDVQRN